MPANPRLSWVQGLAAPFDKFRRVREQHPQRAAVSVGLQFDEGPKTCLRARSHGLSRVQGPADPAEVMVSGSQARFRTFLKL